MRILVTGGGCEEPIDGVRSLCNFSSGATSARVSDRLSEAGHHVTAVMAHRAIMPSKASIVHRFRSFDNLQDIIRELLGSHPFDLVVHAAAVSDFGIGSVQVNGVSFEPGALGKIASGSAVVVHLCENPKIIDHLRRWSCNPRCMIVGFKLTNGACAQERREAVLSLMQRADIDFVVSNDLSEISGDRHPFAAWGAQGCRCLAHGSTKEALAAWLVHLAASYPEGGVGAGNYHPHGLGDTRTDDQSTQGGYA